MSFGALGPSGLDYLPCRYGKSKILFRGPRRQLGAPHIAFFGGTTTYGKFVPVPFPDLIDAQIDATCVNFGCQHAGIDVYVSDPFLRDVATTAQVTVIQITSPSNISNRFYRVHARRNDRLFEASELLRAIYRELDFGAFNFINHMLHHLYEVSPDRFLTILNELQTTWMSRMRLLLSQIAGETILLWTSDFAPPELATDIDADPAFITRTMLDELSLQASDLVEIKACSGARSLDTEGTVFTDMEAAAAPNMLGPQVHREIAEKLLPILKKYT